MSRHALLASLLLPLLALGCEDGGSSGSELRVELLTPSGENPAASIAEGTLRVWIAKNGGAPTESVGDIRAGLFDLPLPLEDVESEHAIEVRLEGGSRPLLGAAPPFSPIRDTRGVARILVGPSASCERLSELRMSLPRSSVAMATAGTFVHLLGGLDRDRNPSRRAEFIDLLELGASPFEPDLASAVGAARGAAFEGGVSVAISEVRSVRFDSTLPEPPRDVPLGVHAGSSVETAVVSFGAGQVVLLGGAIAGEPVAEISWLDPDGQVGARSALAAPRRGAAAAEAGGEIVVAGGQPAGSPALELITPRGGGRAVEGVELRPRRGGWLALSPDGGSALLLGGVDEAGAPVAETELLRNCPSACQVSDGPILPTPRADAAFYRSPHGEAFLIGGRDATGALSARISHVLWEGGEARIDESMELERVRAEASVSPLAGGLFLVAGGEGVEGPRDDLELCVPSELAPL